MKIKKIQLKNGYKRFFDLTIDLGPNPSKVVALVGPNGCGKSSVLDGMLFQANPWGAIGNKGNKSYEYHSLNKTPNFEHSNVIIDFIEGSYQTIRSQRQASGKEQTIFSFRSPYRYNSNLKVTESKATPAIKLNNYGASTFADLDDKMEDNYRRLNIKYNKYLHDENCTPSAAKQKIIGDLNASITKCLDVEISSFGDIQASQGTLYFRKPDQPSEFEFNVLSSGEKEVVDILLDLYLRQYEYDETIFLLDEPELHINTAIQKKLLVEINRLIGDKCQLWIATHSIGFLRALQDELKDNCQIVRFYDGINLASTAHVLFPMKKTISNWRSIFAIALDDLASLVSPKRIIYCEGRDKPGKSGKELGLDAQVFNNIFSGKYHDSLFVSSGGHTELDQRSEIAIAILSKVFETVEILVLKDRDMLSGRVATAADRTAYLQTNPANHRLLNRFEIENYLFDKEVLKKYCADSDLKFDEPGYDAFVTDIANQNVKDETGRIKKFCGITSSLSPEKFKLTLSNYITENTAVFQEIEDCIFPNKVNGSAL